MHTVLNLEARIREALPADRFRLRRRLQSIRQAERQGKPQERNLAELAGQIEQSRALLQERQAGVPAITYSEELPIAARRAEIRQAIAANQVVVVCGETGSGKSTQLPKICLELGRGIAGMIGHTQPRRIAARSVAARIAQELATPLGGKVGFKFRFTDATDPRTYIKLMTDGILLAESQHDRYLNQYDTIILDEAHERSLNIDFLLGYLKGLLPKRPDLKVIVTSATIDAERFSRHFAGPDGPAPIIEVSGRAYPVEIRYRPLGGELPGPEMAASETAATTNEPISEAPAELDWLGGVLAAVDELAAIDQGDMLIFLPSEQDIHTTSKALRGRATAGSGAEILPLYARLSTADQARIFQPHTGRRIVIATNVAESSLTVPGIRYVIDVGTARISRYSPRLKVQRLPIEPVSQASANQRTGRCGRVGPGICIRLYSEVDFQERPRYTAPEILRSNLAAVILQAKTLNLGELSEIDFLDPPRPESVRDGYQTLFELGALDAQHRLTPLGRKLGQLPVDPRLGRIILAGEREGCLREVLIVAAALAVQDPRERPSDKQEAADDAHAQFADETSDFLGYLKLWAFLHELKGRLSQNQFRKACRANFLSPGRVREWFEVHRQLLRAMSQAGLRPQQRQGSYDAIHRAILVGFLANVAQRRDAVSYRAAGGNIASLWPGSGVFAARPKWIVAAEVLETRRRYLRLVAQIKRPWIEELAAHLLVRTHHDPHWDPTVAAGMVFENATLFGLRIVDRRRIRLATLDPAAARQMLIEQGLVRGGYDTRAKFLEHNRQLVRDMENLQRKSRRRQILRGVEAVLEFYEARIPQTVVDGRTFDAWRRTAEHQQPRLLHLVPADLVISSSEVVQPTDYPDALLVGHLRLPLEYRFEPGSDRDGVTVVVPQAGLAQLDRQRLEWIVPGLIEEKILAMIRLLPKLTRRKLIPAAGTVKRVLSELAFAAGSFTWEVARILSQIAGESISPDTFDLQRLPPYLRLRIRVVDPSGRTVAVGRDLDELQCALRDTPAAVPPQTDDRRWQRDEILSWDFDELPAALERRQGKISYQVYPAIVDRGASVSLRLATSDAVAQAQSRAGVRRLFVLANSGPLGMQVEWLPNLSKLLADGAALADGPRLSEELADLIADRAMFGEDESLPRTATEFAQRSAAARQQLGRAVLEVLEVVRPLLRGYSRAVEALAQAGNSHWTYAVSDMHSQLAALTAPGFLSRTPWPWLGHYPRYFRAIELRLEKLAAGGLARDQQAFAEIHARARACEDLTARHAQHEQHNARLVEYRWLLEEFRVSLFAQTLGTSVTVSAQRLDALWQKALAE